MNIYYFKQITDKNIDFFCKYVLSIEIDIFSIIVNHCNDYLMNIRKYIKMVFTLA